MLRLFGLLVIALCIVGSTHTVFASEVIGNLSSDGSTQTTAPSSDTTVVQHESSKTITGSVVGGKSDGEVLGASIGSPSSWYWALLLIPVGLIGLGLYLKRKVL